jgi:hypothetical protein
VNLVLLAAHKPVSAPCFARSAQAEYKYLIKRDKGNVEWGPGGNKAVAVPIETPIEVSSALTFRS